MGGNLSSVIFIVVCAILIMLLIKFFFMRCTKAGKELALKNKNDTLQSSIKSMFTDIMRETNYINYGSAEVLDKINDEIVQKEAIQKETNFMQFECYFNTKLPFEFIGASDSFIKLLGVNSFEEVVKKYELHYQIKKLRKNSLKISLSQYFEPEHDDEQQFVVKLSDVFKLDPIEYKRIVDTVKEVRDDRILIENSNMELQSDLLNSYIKLIYNLLIRDGKLVVEFKIHQILSKVNPVIDNINTDMYKEVMTNLIMDLPFPFIIINTNGIKFLNKTACDWFGIKYNLVDALQKIGTNYISCNDIFDKIDPNLTCLIHENINNSDMVGFYKEYMFNSDNININNSFIQVNTIPKEIIVQGKPFLNINNKKELFVTIQNASAFHSYIIEQDSIKNDETYTINNKKNPALSEFINELSSYNELFKSMFSNTQNISFGRVNLNTKHVIASSNLFEELLRYDSQKERYVKIVENIINAFDKCKPEAENNFYSYDIMFSDKIIKIIYTYHIDYIDILIIENYMQKYLSNNSIKVLSDMYEVSDLPIIIVDKKAEILSGNKIFRSLYAHDETHTSLLHLVPDTDKNKVKRAISDAVKFNSNNLQDDITLLGKDGSFHCRLLCIKTYGKIESEEFITITIFPSDD